MPAQTSSADKKHLAQQARRQAALNSANNRRGRERAPAVAAKAQSKPVEPASSPAVEVLAETVLSAPASMSVELSDAGNNEVDVLCEIADSNPTALGSDINSVRQLCRNRRKALSSKGKAAVPGKNSALGRSGNAARAMAFAAGQINGRDLAKLRRSEMANKGRGDTPVSRPSGRVRPTIAPPKVEVGTTLAGHEVSGTQVERTTAVTGNEQGTCRAITGTEYVGTEQFASFCGTKPEPNTPKVALSITGGGNAVSGTEVGRSDKITGDEQGSCVSVTGSEYIGADKMANFCGVKPSAKPAKVMSGRSAETETRITGANDARVNGTTGTEAGSKNLITGSQYADMGAAKMTINGPSKVALTHTIAGQAITGTEVGRSATVTGDEYGSCRPVTGTEYISNEQFSSVCGTIAEPHPAKVGVDNSRQGQRITGALVDRTEKVTGNEPGSCTHLTGTQYGESKLCGGAAPKVNNMHTLSGGHLTGNSIDLSPKMTGDEQGGCLPVTGTEYYGQEQFAQCPSTPVVAPTQHHGSCCDSCAVRDAAAAAGLVAHAHAAQPMAMTQPQYPVQQAVPAPAPAAAQDFSIVSPARAAQVTGSHSSYHGGGRVTGPGDLATNRVSGTPEFRYPDTRQMVAPTPAPVMTAPAPMPAPARQVIFAPAEQPAAVAQQQMPQANVAQQPMPQHIAQPHIAQPQPVIPMEQAPMHSQRITGEGREGGFTVSGDNWGRAPGMTGTEGHVAQGRNPTLRVGEMQQPVNNAYHNKGMERPEVPAARVTGSSGNSSEGAVITVSGGARG